MKRQLTTIMALTLVAFWIAGCSDHPDREHHHDHHEVGQSDTLKIQRDGNWQFALELQTREEHEKMMKMMNMKMNHGDEDHILSVTVMNLKEKKPYADATITLSMTSPDGKETTRETTPMTGGGMAHHVAGFVMPSSGEYKVHMDAKVAGESFQKDFMFKK